jgi:nitrogen fixation NifU-like protein
VKFRIKGCGAAAIASSSMATEMAKGKRLEEVLMLTDEQVAAALDATGIQNYPAGKRRE